MSRQRNKRRKKVNLTKGQLKGSEKKHGLTRNRQEVEQYQVNIINQTMMNDYEYINAIIFM